jgi:hypothetical protein
VLLREVLCCTAYVCLWPIATDPILVADRRFRGITDMARGGGRPDPAANDPDRTSSKIARDDAVALALVGDNPTLELRLSGRSDLRCLYWLGHPVKNHYALATTTGGECFGRKTEATFEVLPVVHHPNITRRIDSEVCLHL